MLHWRVHFVISHHWVVGISEVASLVTISSLQQCKCIQVCWVKWEKKGRNKTMWEKKNLSVKKIVIGRTMCEMKSYVWKIEPNVQVSDGQMWFNFKFHLSRYMLISIFGNIIWWGKNGGFRLQIQVWSNMTHLFTMFLEFR